MPNRWQAILTICAWYFWWRHNDIICPDLDLVKYLFISMIATFQCRGIFAKHGPSFEFPVQSDIWNIGMIKYHAPGDAFSLSLHNVDGILFMMTSSNGNIFRVTGPLCGEFTGPGEFPAQRPVMRSFDVFFDLRLNKRLSKQPWGWWFETPAWSLWRHRNVQICWELCGKLNHDNGTLTSLFMRNYRSRFRGQWQVITAHSICGV